MLTINSKKIGTSKSDSPGKGIYLLSAPTDEELDRVARECELSLSAIKSALDTNTLTRIYFNHITSVYLDFPYLYKVKINKRVRTIPLGIFFDANKFVVISKRQVPVIHELLESEDIHDLPHSVILLEVMYKVALLYMSFLNQIDQDTEKLEDSMRRRVNNTEIFQLMDYQRSLSGISTSLKGLEHIMDRINSNCDEYCTEDLLEDTRVAVKQASEMASILNSDLDALMEAFGSVLSNNVNQIMKVLTFLTLIISIPTMIAGLFGMNVRLPIGGHPQAFWIIFAISAVFSAIVGIMFYRKRML